ncbi:MAG: hypothetical protein JWP11_1343 [Frankiales bacterium]|nr:hypothetical protein [Frankiales bacterium]
MVSVNATVRGAKELQRELKLIDKRVERATMYAVRQGGRQVKQQAKKNAPVYQGPGAISGKQLRTGPLVVSRNAPVKGLLRSSIHSSKRLKRPAPGTYQVGVAPRGQRVHLYSAKAEARHGYMSRALDAVHPQFRAIAATAYARATRR